MFLQILTNALLQIIYLAAVPVIMGLLVALCNKLFVKLLGRSLGAKAIFATSIIGTPIHELGHAAMCIVFAHKIVGMKLYSTDTTAQTLGYVKHTFSKSNIYQNIGNFFIGIGPIFSGCLVLILGMLLLIPGICNDFLKVIWDSSSLASGIFDPTVFSTTFAGMGKIFLRFFSTESVSNVFWWIYVLIGCCVALHINFSPQDIAGSRSGFVALSIFLLLLNFLIGVISLDWLYFVDKYLMIYNVFMLSFLLIALVFSVMLVVIAAVIWLVKFIVTKIKIARRRRVR